MSEYKLHPTIKADSLIEDAAKRAFENAASEYFSKAADPDQDRAALREHLLKTVQDLGFSEALPGGHDPDTWPDAAAIIRAQAASGAPIDMVTLLVRDDAEGAISWDPGPFASDTQACAGASEMPDDQTTRLMALGRCLQLTGAMTAAVDLSLQYVQDRKQFGRPLSAFQVIQHSLAIAAEEAAAATTITDLCVSRLVTTGNSEQFSKLLQAAAIVCGEASTVVYDTTHQVHGAIGFTREYSLHRHTINLLRWQDDLAVLLGSNIQCAQRLGAQAVSGGGVWKTVTELMGR
jgi:hypothetical protein